MSARDKNILTALTIALPYQIFLSPVSYTTFTNILSTSNAISNFSCLLNYFQFCTTHKDWKCMPLMLMLAKLGHNTLLINFHSHLVAAHRYVWETGSSKSWNGAWNEYCCQSHHKQAPYTNFWLYSLENTWHIPRNVVLWTQNLLISKPP